MSTKLLSYVSLFLIICCIIGLAVIVGYNLMHQDIRKGLAIEESIARMKSRLEKGESVLSSTGEEWTVINIEGCQFLQKKITTPSGHEVPIIIHRPSCPNHKR